MVVLYRDNRSGVESNILFSEERGVGEVTVGIGLPLHYYYRLTYTWNEESDGPMISNDERIRDAQ